jgi:hypothetical protein
MTGTRSAPDHRIVINRWNVVYRVPEGAPFDHADRHRLDELLRSSIAEAFARSVECSIELSDPSVWRIRSLAIELTHEPSQTNNETERQTWATHLAGQVLGEMNESDSSRVLRFPTRAHYLAHFLIDLFRGRAWDRWYFEDFDSLRPLSTSRAICEALLRDEKELAAALLNVLAAHGLHDILDALTVTDAHRLFDSWLSSASDFSSITQAIWVERLLETWSQTPCRMLGDNLYRDGLWWLVITASRYPGCELQREPVHTTSLLLEIRSFFLALPSLWHRGRLLQLISEGRLQQAGELALNQHLSSQTAIAALSELMGGDLDWGLNAISILTGDQESIHYDVSAGLSHDGASYLSYLAGVFRLGPSFLATSTTEILAAGGQPELLPLLIHLVAAKCLGSVRADASLYDVAVRLFSDLASDSFAASFEEAISSGSIAALDHQAIQRTLVSELLSTGHTDPARWAIVMSSSASVLIDLGTRAWLEIVPSVTPSFASLALYPNLQPSKIDEASFSGRASCLDLEFLSLADALPELPPELDLTLSLVARCILDHFARRLMGFHLSSPEHLYQNFLSGSGTLRNAATRIDVTLAPPPLAIVLRLAGIDVESYTPTWLQSIHEGRDICILPERD